MWILGLQAWQPEPSPEPSASPIHLILKTYAQWDFRYTWTLTWDLGNEFTPTGLHFIPHLPGPETVVNIHPKLRAVCMYGTVCVCSGMLFCRFAPWPALLFYRTLISSQKPLPTITPNTIPQLHLPPNFLTLSNSQHTRSSIS